MRVQIKRLWHGFASVRNYIVDNALTKFDNLIINCQDKTMTIPYQEIVKKIVKVNKEKFRSKHDNREYYLVDFEFKPDKIQQQLFYDI